MDRKNRIAVWLKAFRVFTLTGSVIPVAVGGILASGSKTFSWPAFVLSMLAMTAIQIGANLVNDADDYINKVDTAESFNSSGVIVDNLLTHKEVRTAGYLMTAIAILVGLYPILRGGWVIVVLVTFGIAGSYFYTRKPFRFKYRGLGIPLIFLLFGPLPVLGSYYLQAYGFSPKALTASVMIGMLTTAILHANDVRDIGTDSKAGIKTLSIIIGEPNARIFYGFLVSIPYVIMLIAVICRALPVLCLSVLITVPIAIINIRKIYSSDPAELRNLDQQTAKLQLGFGLLLILSLSIKGL